MKTGRRRGRGRAEKVRGEGEQTAGWKGSRRPSASGGCWTPWGKTQTGCSEGFASASPWGRCGAAASRCPESRTRSCCRRDLRETESSVSSSPGRAHSCSPWPSSGWRAGNPSERLAVQRPHVHSLTLSNEVLLKLLQELEVEQVIRGEGLLSHHSLHGLDVLTDGVAGVLGTRGTQSEANVHRPGWVNTFEGHWPEEPGGSVTSWLETSAWSFLVIPSPMADFIRRDSEGNTLMGG